MQVSAQGIELLIGREDLRTEAYQDGVGVWTIGVGHTGPEVSENVVWTREKCEAVFTKDLQRFEDAINSHVTVDLEQFQFDALVSFAFNVGIGAFESSTMLKLINAGDMEGAAGQFERWHIPPEIISRRNGERAQFEGTAFQPRLEG